MHTWVHKKQEIEKRVREGRPAPLTPANLLLNEIEIIDEVFQHRSENYAASERHVEALTRALKASQGSHFDPLTVFWIGDAWCLVDGHHRYAAYSANHHKTPVPINVFEGGLDDAIGEALRGNSRDKLVMGSQEKSEATWRLVIGTALSLNAISDASGRSRQTVITMRKVRNKIQESWPDRDIATLSWESAQRLYKGLSQEVEYGDAWMEREAKALADRLVRVFGTRLGGQPDMFWRALEIYDRRLTANFLEAHGIDPTEDSSPEF